MKAVSCLSDLIFTPAADAAISGEPRTATIVAVGDATLISLPAADFVALVTENPMVARAFLKSIADILRTDTARLTTLTTLPALQRVTAMILLEYEKQKTDLITIPSRVEWAGHMAMTRETLSRVLNDLAGQGLIGIEEAEIWVKDVEGLRRMQES